MQQFFSMPNEEEVKKALKIDKLPKEEMDKHHALLVGVVFFMILIIILWMMNVRSVLKSPVKPEASTFDVDKFTQEFQRSFNEVGSKMSELREITPELLSGASTSDATIKK